MRRTNAARRLAPAWAAAMAFSASAYAQPGDAGKSDPSDAAPADVGSSSARAPGARSLEACVVIALGHNPDALSSNYDVSIAEAAQAGVRGQLGPQLRLDANAQQWTGPYDILFPFPGANGMTTTENFPVRNAFTWAAGVTLTQPLTPLWSIFEQYKVQAIGVDVAAIKRVEVRREVAFEVAEAYYRLLEAERLSDVADASVAQLVAEEKQARSNYTNGVIAKNDLLRAALALATARQRSIQAAGAVVLARAQLAQRMGLEPGEAVEAVPFAGDPPAMGDGSLASSEERAVAMRPEVREVARRIEQAQASARYAKTRLLPQVNAVGNYTHTEGSPFQQVDGAYVGLVGSWNLWDWGTTASGIAQANAQLEQARLARRKLEDQVRIEARRAFVDATTAHDGLDVARVAVTQAEENFRIVTRKFENATATSFDVVDAEALLTQARGQVETALYDYLIARVGLERATGAALPGGE